MKIGIVGGGPAGLFFAYLMKRRDPAHRIRVVERDAADATYGWGVVFSDVALGFVRDAAPALHDAMTRARVVHPDMRIVHRGRAVRLANNPFHRMARIDLLRALRSHCEALGIDIEFGRRATDIVEFADCDLVVAADGAASAIRARFADRFEPAVDERPNLLAWYGTTRRFDPLSLIFRSCDDGLLIAHAYRYSATHSTFLVEADPRTFRDAGLDRMSVAESLAYCERVFAEDLDGHPLLSNNSNWFRYPIVRNRRWHFENVVLLGDALRTGHPSVGSGTRLAMQDSIALFEACVACGDDVAEALADFERRRRPGSDALQQAAIRSTEWYESVRSKLDLDPISFAYDYVRRTGRVSHDDVRERDPELAAAYEALHPPGHRTMNDRAAFYDRIAGRNLRPLWEVLDDLVPPAPKPSARAALWRYDDIRPAILESGSIISAMEAVRRVLILENPGMPGSSLVTTALYAGLQLILPGEIAPSHRHTQSALRFIVEGSGAYTAVDGERTTMHPGDFIITPSWTWHDHGNDGSEPVVWLDGLDIPIVALHDAQFAERCSEPVQPLRRAEGDSDARWASNMATFDHSHATKTSPVFSYPYTKCRAAIATVAKSGACDPAHGVRMRYVNPVTGGWAMPTMATFLQLLPRGFRGVACRSTDATVYCCVEGRGGVRIGDERFEFGPRDIFVVPSWQARTFTARDEVVLFGYSDRPVQEALGLLREQTLSG